MFFIKSGKSLLQRGIHRGQLRGHGGLAFGVARALGGRPDGGGKVAVPVVAGNDVPVQVRHDVAQRGQVDLAGLQLPAQHLFGQRHGVHAVLALGGGEVGKLGHMRVPDDAVEGGKARLVGADEAQVLALPDQLAARLVAQHAGHSSTFSMPPLLARCTNSGIQFLPRIWLHISMTM